MLVVRDVGQSELDADYSGNSLDPPVEADESHELTYVDTDTLLHPETTGRFEC